MLERMQVELEMIVSEQTTALGSIHGHIADVQYLCEQGAHKEARDIEDKTRQDTTALGSALGLPPSVEYGRTPL